MNARVGFASEAPGGRGSGSGDAIGARRGGPQKAHTGDPQCSWGCGQSPGLVSFSSSSAGVATLSDFGEWMINTTEPAQLRRHPNLPKMLSFSFRR